MKKTIYSDKQKAQIVLDTIKGQKTINQISSQFQIHPTQINRWKTIVLENLPNIFSNDIQKTSKFLENGKKMLILVKIR
ncbi:MAG: transposase [Patescibacteria group bacterium]